MIRISGSQAEMNLATEQKRSQAIVRWQLLGAQPGRLSGVDQRPASTNYFVGNQRRQWRTGVAQYGKVRAESVYPGIDAVWYTAGKQLEYDFVVAPGADPSKIRFNWDGTSAARLNEQGDLEVSAGEVTLRQHRPVIYQTVDGERRSVEGSYQIASNGEVSFRLGSYDRSRELVIDPQFSYANYLGGTTADVARAIAFDAQGHIWITGWTKSAITIPDGTNPFKNAVAGGKDVFLARYRKADGTQGGGTLEYYTYIGGTGDDTGVALTVGSDNAIYLTGTTASTDWPLGGSPSQTANAGGTDAFVVRYDPSIAGDYSMTYSTYAGTPGEDIATALTLDSNRLVTIVGYTDGITLPTSSISPAQPSNRGGTDAFVFRTNPFGASGQTLSIATFFGGDGADMATGVGVDADGKIFFTGTTFSTDFPVAGNYFNPRIDGGDGFFVGLDPSKSGLDGFIYGTYFGGVGLDYVTGMVRDSAGLYWVTGYTTSADFRTSDNAPQRALLGSIDAFVWAVDPTQPGGSFFRYGTLIGGSGNDLSQAIATDNHGKVTLAGYSDSTDFKFGNSPTIALPGALPFDSLLTEIDTTKSGSAAIVYGALYGGSQTDIATGVAMTSTGWTAVAGYTTSTDLPTAAPIGKQSGNGMYAGFFLVASPDPQ